MSVVFRGATVRGERGETAAAETDHRDAHAFHRRHGESRHRTACTGAGTRRHVSGHHRRRAGQSHTRKKIPPGILHFISIRSTSGIGDEGLKRRTVCTPAAKSSSQATSANAPFVGCTATSVLTPPTSQKNVRASGDEQRHTTRRFPAASMRTFFQIRSLISRPPRLTAATPPEAPSHEVK